MAVAILAALFASVNLGQKPAAAAGTATIRVILYDAANWGGSRVR